jgi:hypothetical protein
MPASKKKEGTRVQKRSHAKTNEPPEWAAGLRRLYDSVVDEPLPDAFKDLLSRLGDDQA